MVNNKIEYKELFYYLNLVFNLSWIIVCCIAVGGGLGFFADKFFFNKAGVFFIFGILLGIFAGFWQAYKLIMKKNFDEHC
jgi:F0F1-type ATP synthase assembly protein I